MPEPAAPGAAADFDMLDSVSPVRLVEQVGPRTDGRRWRIVVIEAGTSQNGNVWTDALLAANVSKFDGVPVFEDHDSDAEREEHPFRRVGDKIGVLEQAAFVAGDSPDSGRVEADLVVIAQRWRTDLVNAQESNRLDDFVQFSVNVLGTGRVESRDGRRVTVIETVDHVRSVDAVNEASAGGRIVRRLESKGSEPDMNLDELKAAIASVVDERLAAAGVKPKAESGDDGTAATDPKTDGGTPTASTASTDPTPAPAPAPKADPAPAPAPVAPAPALAPSPAAQAPVAQATDGPGAQAQAAVEALSAQVAELRKAQADLVAAQARHAIGEAVAASNLPDHAAARVRTVLEAKATAGALDAAAIREAIEAERAYAAAFVQGHAPVVPGMASGVTSGPDRREVYRARLVGMFTGRPTKITQEGKEVEVAPYQSIRQAYHAWNPSSDIWGGGIAFDVMEELAVNWDSRTGVRRVREGLSVASWGQIMADVMHQVLIDDYSKLPYNWRSIVSDVEPVADFRTRHWMAVGGYGNLQTVPEGHAYPVAASPGDEEETYTIAKRGLLEESITLEMIANDRVGALRRIPTSLSDAAGRTLYRFVMDLATTDNPTLGDGVTLYHVASHANQTTAALSVSALHAIEVAMRSQTARLNTAEILGPRNLPRYVIVPNELNGVARRVLNPSAGYQFALSSTPDADTSLDPATFAGRNIEPLVYDYLTDANDYYTVADPTMVPTMVVGFFGGNESPELFVQDDPNAGTHFNNDTRAVKVRHIYGGTILDYRSFHKAAVT